MDCPQPLANALKQDTRLPQLRQLLDDDACQHIYIVGGAVRDAITTGQLPADLDMVTTAGNAMALAQTLAKQLNSTLVPLHEELGMVRVVWHSHVKDEPPTYIDLSDAVGNSISEDLVRRDLSINAMAVSLNGEQFFDPYDGLSDLTTGVIRGISKTNFVEDPLRLLRVFRFAATTDATNIHPDTLAWVAELNHTLWNVAAERIQTEWLKLLSASNTYPWLCAMGQCGLLEALIPELTATKAIPPNSHHHLDLWHHTLELVKQLEATVLPSTAPEWQQHLTQPFAPGITKKGVLTFGCLMHDIGKPATHEILETGRHAFHGHDKVGDEMTIAICKRLKTGNTIAKQVAFLVRWHLYPCAFTPQSAQKSLLRFYRRMGDLTPDVLLLAMADRLSTRGPDITDAMVSEQLDQFNWLLTQYPAMREKEQVPPLLSGTDIMQLLNLPQGRHIGDCLKQVREKQLLGELTTADDAKQWLQQHVSPTV